MAIYVGGTEAGSRSSLSHTGAITSPDEFYDGLFRQGGVIRAEDLDHMLDLLWILSMQPVPAGGRMAVITNSGGPGSSLAYHIEKAGLTVPAFSEGLRARLDAVTGHLAYTGNPIDLTFETNIFIFKELLEMVYASGEVDGAFIYGIFGVPDFMANLNKRLPELQAVQDTEDDPRRRGTGLPAGRYASTVSRRGRVKRKAEPPSSRASYQILPPWASTMRFPI